MVPVQAPHRKDHPRPAPLPISGVSDQQEVYGVQLRTQAMFGGYQKIGSDLLDALPIILAGEELHSPLNFLARGRVCFARPLYTPS